MSARDRDTAPGWDDPDESPEWTDEMFDRARISFKGHICPRGERDADQARPGAAGGCCRDIAVAPAVARSAGPFPLDGGGLAGAHRPGAAIHVRMMGEMRRSVAEALQAKPRVAEEQEGYKGEGGEE